MIRRFFEKCAKELGIPAHRVERWSTYQLMGEVLWTAHAREWKW